MFFEGETAMTRYRKPALLGLLALAAALPAQAAPGIQPGEWEIAVTINSVDMPSAPAGVANMMRGKTTTIRHCITPADAARGPQDMLKSDRSCSFTKYSMAAGRLSSEMTCVRRGMTLTASSSGTFTPVSFTATGRSVATGGMTMTTTSTTTGRRVGDCKG